jgi:hypothetical protein
MVNNNPTKQYNNTIKQKIEETFFSFDSALSLTTFKPSEKNDANRDCHIS